MEAVLAINKLHDTGLRTLKIGAPRQSDGGGLYLLPAKKESESHGWRFDYSYDGKRRTISLGVYPEVPLAEARVRAGECRTEVAHGRDPSALRKIEKQKLIERLDAERLLRAGEPAKGSFEEVARRWYEKTKSEWMESYSSKVLRRLELHVFPYVGHLPIGELDVPGVLEVCRRVQGEGKLETGMRVKELCSRVFRFAIAEATVRSDPCRDIGDALEKPQETHFAALIKPAQVGEYLRRADAYEGTFPVQCALRLAPMLMVRPGELRQSKWEEFDLDNGLWIVPSVRLKRTKKQKLEGKPHLVYLPRQAIEILEELFLLTGRTGFVFAGSGPKHKCISNSTVNAALRRMGYCTKTEVTAHGFRATSRTLTVELLNFPEAVAEMQLAHAVKDENGDAYNRAEFLEQRRAMMQAWADYLEDLKHDRAILKHPVLTEFTPVTLRLAAANGVMRTRAA
jgi:integrase